MFSFIGRGPTRQRRKYVHNVPCTEVGHVGRELTLQNIGANTYITFRVRQRPNGPIPEQYMHKSLSSRPRDSILVAAWLTGPTCDSVTVTSIRSNARHFQRCAILERCHIAMTQTECGLTDRVRTVELPINHKGAW